MQYMGGWFLAQSSGRGLAMAPEHRGNCQCCCARLSALVRQAVSAVSAWQRHGNGMEDILEVLPVPQAYRGLHYCNMRLRRGPSTLGTMLFSTVQG